MEPALFIPLAVVSILALQLTGDLVFRCLAAIGTSRFRGSPAVRSAIVGCTAAMVLASALRLPANAITPPPMVRFTEMEVANPEAHIQDERRDAAAVVDATSYTVAPGDSLWRIARTVLEARAQPSTGSDVSSFWRSIYDANRQLIGSDPNLIHPDQVFVIPGG